MRIPRRFTSVFGQPIRNTPCNERDELMREIERTDRHIDNLVYDLYGLTEEERKIVEEETKEGDT